MRKAWKISAVHRRKGKGKLGNLSGTDSYIFVYTYFCGAVYDDMVYTKMVLAVFSVFWIDELCFAKWLQNQERLTFSEIVQTAYEYAREIEHSDENLNLLEEIFHENGQYSPRHMADIA